MRKIWIAAVSCLLFTAFLFPSVAISADNEPSDLATFLLTAFEHPDRPEIEGFPTEISAVTLFGELLVVLKGESAPPKGHDHPGEYMWLYSENSWQAVLSNEVFENSPVSFLTVFERDCPEFSVLATDALGGTFELPNIQSFLTTGLFRLAGTNPSYSAVDFNSFMGGPLISGVGTLGCVVAVADNENLRVYLPGNELNMPLSNAIVGPPWGISPWVTVPLRNGADGLLDGIISSSEVIGGIELERNNGGALALVVITDRGVYLVEFEEEGIIYTTIAQ